LAIGRLEMCKKQVNSKVENYLQTITHIIITIIILAMAE